MRALAHLSTLTIRSRLLLTLACGLLVLILQASLAYRTVSANRTAAAAVVHTREVIGLADEALTSLVETQSDYRGYLLTGDAAFVLALADSDNSLEGHLRDLRRLTADNPAQVARWQQISAEVAEWQRTAVEPAIAVRQRSDGAMSPEIVAQLPDGQLQVDSIRAAFAQAIGVEEALMVERSRGAEAANGFLVAVLLGGPLGTAGIGLALVLLMSRTTAGAVKDDVDRLQAIIAAQAEIARADLHPDARFAIITRHAQALTDAAGTVVEMAEGDEIVCHAVSGSAQAALGLRVPLDGSLSGQCIRTGQTLLCVDAQLDPRVNAAACVRVGVRAMVVAPLVSEGNTIGVLKVISPTPGAFGERDVDTLRLAAGLLGAALDHAQAFRDKEQSEARFRAVSESAHEAIVSADADDRIVFWNPAAARLFAYAPDDMLGLPFEQLLPMLLASVDRENTHEVMLQSVGQRQDGSRFPVEFSLARWEAEGQTYTTGILRDITERQVVERLKDELISVVSHELRTPLTSIRGSLGLLAAGLLKTAPDKAQRMLDIAVQNTDRLTRLVNEFLDLSRLQTGRLESDRQVCSAPDLIEQALAAMRGSAEAAGVDLAVRADPQPGSAPTALAVDGVRIVQVLSNLLSNAIKFSAPGDAVRIWSETDGADFVFGVQDVGQGIPADKLDSIFERFQQLDPSNTRQQGGTGLGLTICKTIVQQHNGRITVTSTLGAGSTFKVFLPAQSAVLLAA